MTGRARQWVAWGAIVGFLPLYVAVGLQLRPWGGFGADALRMRAVGYAVGGGLLLVAAVGLGAPLRRIDPVASAMIRWHLAEGVAICGFLAWVEGGSPVQLAAHAVAAAAVLVALRPR